MQPPQPPGPFEDAIQAYRKAVPPNPDDVNSHLCLGTLYLHKGDNVAAAAEYDELKAVAPNTLPRPIRRSRRRS